MPKTNSLRSLLRNRRGYRLLQQKLRSIASTLLPAAIALSFATVAHAQGTMDFSGAQTLMGTFKTFAVYAGAVICFGGLIFAGIRMMSGRFQDAIPGLFGALFASLTVFSLHFLLDSFSNTKTGNIWYQMRMPTGEVIVTSLVVVLIGVVIGSFGSYLGIRRFLDA